jgi:hypothetical protein
MTQKVLAWMNREFSERSLITVYRLWHCAMGLVACTTILVSRRLNAREEMPKQQDN